LSFGIKPAPPFALSPANFSDFSQELKIIDITSNLIGDIGRFYDTYVPKPQVLGWYYWGQNTLVVILLSLQNKLM
jgi:hypothetical protein